MYKSYICHIYDIGLFFDTSMLYLHYTVHSVSMVLLPNSAKKGTNGNRPFPELSWCPIGAPTMSQTTNVFPNILYCYLRLEPPPQKNIGSIYGIFTYI